MVDEAQCQLRFYDKLDVVHLHRISLAAIRLKAYLSEGDCLRFGVTRSKNEESTRTERKFETLMLASFLFRELELGLFEGY